MAFFFRTVYPGSRSIWFTFSMAVMKSTRMSSPVEPIPSYPYLYPHTGTRLATGGDLMVIVTLKLINEFEI